jgi:hypothetical protein
MSHFARARSLRFALLVGGVSLGLAGVVAACGLSFDFVGIVSDASLSPSADVLVLPKPSTDPDRDAELLEAGPDGDPGPQADAADILAGDSGSDGCTRILKEDFSTNAGAFTLVGPRTVVTGGKLQILPDANDATNVSGAAYFNPPGNVQNFTATFVVTTGQLRPVYDTADGFAISWLEKPLLTPALKGGNELGLTLDPAGQHGFGIILDIYPQGRTVRYFAENEVGPTLPRNGLGALGDLVGTGSATLHYKIVRRGSTYDYSIALSGGVTAQTLTKTVTNRGVAATATKSFLFSSAAGAAHSPGFFLDDVEIQSCP